VPASESLPDDPLTLTKIYDTDSLEDARIQSVLPTRYTFLTTNDAGDVILEGSQIVRDDGSIERVIYEYESSESNAIVSEHIFSKTADETNEFGLYLAFEESRDQLGRNAIGWGMNLDDLESAGQLKVVCEYPESAGLEDHLIKIKKLIMEFKPTRMAIDSLSALERASSEKGFREFVLAITAFAKHREVTGMFTSTTPTLLGGTSITEAHISSITDSIFLLRYVELFGEMRRGLTVLKMRGSQHDKNIREFNIDQHGMHVGKPFLNVAGILAGTPTQIESAEIERFDSLFAGAADD